MKDLEGKLIKSVSGQQYLLTEIAGQGAQGVVYNEVSDKYLVKLYKNGTVYQNINKLRKLEWLTKQNYPDQFIKPLDIIKEPYIGYVMEKVKEHASLNKLVIPPRDMSFSEWYNNRTGGIRRRLFLAYKIAMQFSLLHDTNRAYCDISGNNILVSDDPKVASVCMIDIDNIYIPGGDSGNVLGTSRYMAPEIMNKKILPDIFTDDYSLAVILFELLRVGHPYIGDMVDDGTPEQQAQAYLGLYPYVDDEETDINRSTQMLPADVVFTSNLKELFARTFIKGKDNRVERIQAREFALACLEASNKVMKCEDCGNWHLAVSDENRKYICPWCDAENERPLFLSFKDRYYVRKSAKNHEAEMVSKTTHEKVVFEERVVNSFVLRDEKNVITNNYISNFYIKRDKFAKPVDQYFSIRKAKDGKFYLINASENELYYQKYGDKKSIQLTKKEEPVEIGYKDMIFFSDPTKMTVDDIEKNYQGIVFRYATIL